MTKSLCHFSQSTGSPLAIKKKRTQKIIHLLMHVCVRVLVRPQRFRSNCKSLGRKLIFTFAPSLCAHSAFAKNLLLLAAAPTSYQSGSCCCHDYSALHGEHILATVRVCVCVWAPSSFHDFTWHWHGRWLRGMLIPAASISSLLHSILSGLHLCIKLLIRTGTLTLAVTTARYHFAAVLQPSTVWVLFCSFELLFY